MNKHYEDYHYGKGCYGCEAKEEKLTLLAEHLEEVIKMLYSKETLNPVHLEHELDEMCYMLHVKNGVGDLTIERKDQPIMSINSLLPLEKWMETKQLTQIA